MHSRVGTQPVWAAHVLGGMACFYLGTHVNSVEQQMNNRHEQCVTFRILPTFFFFLTHVVLRQNKAENNPWTLISTSYQCFTTVVMSLYSCWVCHMHEENTAISHFTCGICVLTNSHWHNTTLTIAWLAAPEVVGCCLRWVGRLWWV